MSGSRRTRRGRLSTTVFIVTLLVVSIVLALLLTIKRDVPKREIAEDSNAMSLFPGFTVAEQGTSDIGLVITSLRTGSDAEKQGISVGDRILAIDKHPVKNLRDANIILKNELARPISLKVGHDNSARDIILRENEGKDHGS